MAGGASERVGVRRPVRERPCRLSRGLGRNTNGYASEAAASLYALRRAGQSRSLVETGVRGGVRTCRNPCHGWLTVIFFLLPQAGAPIEVGPSVHRSRSACCWPRTRPCRRFYNFAVGFRTSLDVAVGQLGSKLWSS